MAPPRRSAPLLAALALVAAPDIVPPGHKSVVHELVVEPGPALESWRLVAAPTAGFGVVEVTPGVPFAFSSKYGTRLYAAPRSSEPLPQFEGAGLGDAPGAWFAGKPAAALPPEIATVPVANPLARVLTTARITAIDADAIALEVVREERFDAAGRPVVGARAVLPWLLGISALGVLGLVLIGKRARQRPELG